MEYWKDIKGYEGLYQVSNLGRVKSLKRHHLFKGKFHRVVNEKILTPCLTKGYKQIRLCKEGKSSSFYIHRLIAKHFISNPNNKPHINHINGIATDNSLENLEWCTHKENMRHAWEIGLINNRGQKCGTSKLSEKDVVEIRRRKETQLEIAKEYKVSQSTISSIKRGQNWGWL